MDTRRITALVLCCALLFSACPVLRPQTAAAETVTTVTSESDTIFSGSVNGEISNFNDGQAHSSSTSSDPTSWNEGYDDYWNLIYTEQPAETMQRTVSCLIYTFQAPGTGTWSAFGESGSMTKDKYVEVYKSFFVATYSGTAHWYIGEDKYGDFLGGYTSHGNYTVPYTIYGSVTVDYTNTTTTVYKPAVTANDLVKYIGDPIPSYNWTQGVTAQWTNPAKTDHVFGDSYGTTYGTITSLTDQVTIDNALPNMGGTVTGVGSCTQSLQAQDNSGSKATANDQQTANRTILFKTRSAPNLTGWFDNAPQAATPYESGTWTNRPVTVKANAAIDGYYRNALYRGDTQPAGDAAPTVSGASSTGGTADDACYTLSNETGADGVTFWGRMLTGGKENTALSETAGPLVVRIDLTDPVPDAEYNEGIVSDRSGDDLSGLNTQATKFAAVAADSGEPDPGDYVSADDFEITVPGFYDIWVQATDNAGNTARALPAATTGVLLKTTAAPFISGSNAAGTLASDTWSNTDVTVTVSDNPNVPGLLDLGLFRAGSDDYIKQGPATNDLSQVYSDETDGTYSQYYGIYLLEDRTVVSAPTATYIVKIDKTAPTAAVKLQGDHATFSDTSTDLLGTANSGVDEALTRVAVVPTGATAQDGDFVATDDAQVPADDGYYDVWAQATDHAGNTSQRTKAYTHINRAALDAITAQDFRHPVDRGALTDADAKELAVVSAVYYNGGAVDFGDLVVDAAQLQAINDAIKAGEYGPHSLTFSTPAVNPNVADDTRNSVTVTVTLTGHGDVDTAVIGDADDNGMRIYANDFLYGVNRGQLDADGARALAAVSLYDTDNAALCADGASVDADELAAINAAVAAGDVSHNTWPLTFTAPDYSAAVTVQVTLKQAGDANDAPNSGDVSSLAANNFSYGVNEPPLDAVTAVTYAGTVAHDIWGNRIPAGDVVVDVDQLTSIQDAQDAGLTGAYPLTFATPDATAAVTVTVTLTESGVNMSGVGVGDHITANDFSYGADETTLTADIAKVLANVDALDADGNPIAREDIRVDADQLAALVDALDAGQTGELPLTFITPDDTQLTVTVTVTQHGAGSVDGTGDHIAGNDFTYGVDETTLTDEIAKVLAHVDALDADGNPIALEDISVDANQLAAINSAIGAGATGDYALTFSTPDDTQLTVTVTLQDRGAGVVGDGDHVTGNDFSYGSDEPTLTADDAKILANIDAVDKDGRPIDDSLISVDATDLAVINDARRDGQTGDYDLTFRTPDGTTVTVAVRIVVPAKPEPTPIQPQGNDRISAKGFTYAAEGKKITASIAKSLAQVIAVDKNGNAIDLTKIKVEATSLAALKAAQKAKKRGIYVLTFVTPDGTTHSVNVKLTVKNKQDNNGTGKDGNGDTDLGNTGEAAWTWVPAAVVIAAAACTFLALHPRRKQGA
ncbi:MAG: hypothetical protein LBS17_02365 [Actinomycetes bacterium]|nr:hypothetical protein [Actinomycetes bacterium]